MLRKKYINPIWYFYFALVCLEFILFKWYVAHNIEGFYPFSFDQADYLHMSHSLYENIKQYGLIAGITQSTMLHNGILFPLQAVGLFFLFGASRFSALLLNFFYFALLQFFIVFTTYSLTKKNYLVLLFLGLVLCINTPFFYAGGMLDFRMDFLAFCLYGTFVCATLQSRLFLDKKWSLIASVIASLLILSRFITLAYIVPLLGCVFIYLMLTLRRPNNSTRVKHLLQSSLLIITCILPYLWLSKESIYHYYFSTHVAGTEKYIRLSEVGVRDMFSYITFYPHSLLMNHLGSSILFFGAGLLCLYFILYFKARSPSPSREDYPWQIGWVFLILSTCIPLIILTLDVSKSTVVGSIVAIPCLWLFFWAYFYFDTRIVLSSRMQMLFTGLTALALVLGLHHQVRELTRPNSATKQQDLMAITQMYQDIGDYALAKKWENIFLSVDQISDFLTHSSIKTLYYENNHIMLNASIEKMGNTIFEVSKKDILASLEKSNVVIVNLNDYPKGSPYPFNNTIGALKPLINNYTKRNMKPLGDYAFHNTTFRVYVLR